MPHDYIPRPDGDFTAWANNYNEAVHKFWEAQGLDLNDLKPLEQAIADWNKDYAAHVSAQAKAEAAAAQKRQARGVLEPEARRIAAFIQTYPKTTDADRATIGIRVRVEGGPPSPTPTTRPLARVESGNRLTHTLRFSDESTPTRKAKPKGVQGAEVWLALAEPNAPAPPLGDSYKFLSVSSRGNLQTDFPSAEAGKTAYYALRWVSTRGEKGPWSEVCAATVAA
jgi:predicted NBD/HSP70 family sugar kinase